MGKPREAEHIALIRAVVRELNLEPVPDSLVWIVRKSLHLDRTPYTYWIGKCEHTDGDLFMLKVLLKELGTGRFSIAEATKERYLEKEDDSNG